MSQPLVSVLLPVHNGASYIVPALESIIAQTYSNFEVIIIDDGSQDNTLQLIEDHRTTNMTVLTQSHEGLGFSINRGIAQSVGDFIVLHGGDDISYPNRLERQVRLFAEEKVDIVSCLPDVINGVGSVIGMPEKFVFKKVQSPHDSTRTFCELFFNGNFLCAPAVAFRRSVWQRSGKVHSGLQQLQDFEFWLRASASGHTFYVEESAWTAYRWHGNNLSSKANDVRMQRELKYVYRRLMSSISDNLARVLLGSAGEPMFRDTSLIPSRISMPFVAVQHSLRPVRELGFEALIEIMQSDTDMRIVNSQTGLTRSRIMAALMNDY